MAISDMPLPHSENKSGGRRGVDHAFSSRHVAKCNMILRAYKRHRPHAFFFFKLTLDTLR